VAPLRCLPALRAVEADNFRPSQFVGVASAHGDDVPFAVFDDKSLGLADVYCKPCYHRIAMAELQEKPPPRG
jgi:hypothetical protein